MSKKLSIITACYNSAATIGKCIQSRQESLGGVVWHLIQDGGSTDETLRVIESFRDPNIRVTSAIDSGIYDALNMAVERTNTDWLAFLHSDDCMTYGGVIEDIGIAERLGLSAISYGVTFCNSSGRVFRRWDVNRCRKHAFRFGFMMPHTGLVVRRDLFEKFGKFRLDLGTAADYEWILRVFYKESVVPLMRPGTFLVKMRAGGASDKGIKERLGANSFDRKAWDVNGLRPSPLFRFLKPLRKFGQFF